MLLSYLKLKFNIFYRSIKLLGIYRILFILSVFLLLGHNLYLMLDDFQYKRIVLITLYCAFIFYTTALRKDIRLLKALNSKYKQLYFIENLVLSAPFFILDFILIPIYLIINVMVVLLHGYFHFSATTKTKIIKSVYKMGSIEWESLFRRYSLYALSLWVLLFAISLYFNNENLSLIIIIIFSIELTAVNYFIDPLYYLKQYQSKIFFYLHKSGRILTNMIFPVLVLSFIYLLMFPHKLTTVLTIITTAVLYMIGSYYIKLAFSDNESVLRLVQGLLLAVCIASFINPSLIIELMLAMSYIVFKAHKNLKKIWLQ